MILGGVMAAPRAQGNLYAMQASRAPQAPGKTQTSRGTQAAAPSTEQAAGTTQAARPGTTQGENSHGWHFVTVKFDYDFSKTPACSAKVKTNCIQEFVAYDISGGVKHRIKLFEIPLPPKPVGAVVGITGRSPTKLDFESGKHLIAVVGREPDGKESGHRVCTTWIEIP